MNDRRNSSVRYYLSVGDKVLCPIFVAGAFRRAALGDVIFVNDFYCTVEITVGSEKELCLLPESFYLSSKEKYCITFDYLQVRGGYVQKVCAADARELSAHLDVLGRIFISKSEKNMRKTLGFYKSAAKVVEKCTNLGIA